ncbi:unnamed protein product [Rhizoctonia solani]|uniref:Uncharacterized protein n=2 Tax=Rhizoctonia solani TaxID=456999 RepID=A0A8H3BJL1_9AGAM|nr:hypothetical protein V565_162610 [Rhizoctonia solani 123E]CAE6387363.1 unnamed protein product [Rhizoctonia solani]CAE6457528.1 unnamed protein product [Rhizoctonia solani]
MDPHPYLVELAQAGSESLRAGILNVPAHERDFLEAWCRDTLSNYASTPALSRTPSSLMGMIAPSSLGHIASASTSSSDLASPPPLDSLVLSPGPNGGCKDMFKSIPLDAVLYELEMLLEEVKFGNRPMDTRPTTPLSFNSEISSSGTISSFSAPRANYAFAQHPSLAFSRRASAGLSPMQQLIAEGPRAKGVGIRSAGRARAGSFAVRGVV